MTRALGSIIVSLGFLLLPFAIPATANLTSIDEADSAKELAALSEPTLAGPACSDSTVQVRDAGNPLPGATSLFLQGFQVAQFGAVPRPGLGRGRRGGLDRLCPAFLVPVC